MRWAWLWLGVVWGLGLITGGLHVLAVPLLMGAGQCSRRSWPPGTVVVDDLPDDPAGDRDDPDTTVLVSVGHWLPWFCCIPLFFMSGGRSLEFLAKFQAGLTPPAVLAILAFHSQEFAGLGGLRDDLHG